MLDFWKRMWWWTKSNIILRFKAQVDDKIEDSAEKNS